MFDVGIAKDEIFLKFGSDHESYVDGNVVVHVPDEVVRKFLKVVWKNKPELVHEIVCDDCPEVK